MVIDNEKKKKRTFIQRILRISGLLIGFLIIGLYIGFPVGMGVAAISPAKEGVGPPPAGFQEISLLTADKETLAAWYRPPKNGAVIVLVHGAGSSREGVRLYAEMLARNGYGVLALDLRGHGNSSGKTNRLGWTAHLISAPQSIYFRGEKK